MIRFPPAKINLGLNVIRKRADGYHDLRSVMIPIPLHDILEVAIDPALKPGEVDYSRTGLPVKGDLGSDLCMRAFELFREYRSVPGLRVHLHKVIPMGAGLGGGSSDGANMLLLLNDLLDAELEAELPELASDLGSDCPFFLRNVPQLIEGRGENTRELEGLDLSGKWLMLIDPGIHISTADVFRSFAAKEEEKDVHGSILRPIGHWQDILKNDLEETAFRSYPELRSIKQELLRQGAQYAAMSGSGSAVFGIFDEKPLGRLQNAQYQWILRL